MTASSKVQRAVHRMAADTKSAEAPFPEIDLTHVAPATPASIEQSVSQLEQHIRGAAPEARLAVLRIKGRETFAPWLGSMSAAEIDDHVVAIANELDLWGPKLCHEEEINAIVEEITGATPALNSSSEVDEDGDMGELRNEPGPKMTAVQAMVLPPLTLSEWEARDLPAADFLLGSVLSTTNRMLIAAKTGLGKTNVAIAMGIRIAGGAPFLHWAGSGKPRRVLYIDGEMSRRLLKLRMRTEVDRFGANPETFFALSHEDIPNFQPLNTPDGQAWIKAFIAEIGGLDLVIFDNIQSLISGSMIDEISWSQTIPFVRSLTRRNIGQIWIHHTGHDEARSYGTKTREWQMDTVAILEQVKRPDTEVSFKLTFGKARERAPSNRRDFQDVEIALADDAWVYKAEAGADASDGKKISPKATQVLASLKDTASRAQSTDLKGVDNQAWMAACDQAGLVDLAGKRDAARSQFSRYRKELVDAGLIGVDGDRSWPMA